MGKLYKDEFKFHPGLDAVYLKVLKHQNRGCYVKTCI